MSGYLDNFGPEINSGEVFTDLFVSVEETIGEAGAPLSADPSKAVIPGTEVSLHRVDSEIITARGVVDARSIMAIAPDVKGNSPIVLLTLEERRTGDEAFEPAKISAAGTEGWFPTYSVERNLSGTAVICRQLIETQGPENLIFNNQQEAGASKFTADERLGFAPAGAIGRMDLVSSVILRNLDAIEFLKEGLSLKEALAAANEKSLEAATAIN